MKNCLGCGSPLSSDTLVFHPSCMSGPQVREALAPLAKELGDEVKSIVLWADRNSDRSLQTAPGPSELGDPCDRRLGYLLAQTPEVNTAFDPWAAIVGTAIHGWLEQAIQRHRAATGAAWTTEQELAIDAFVLGHSDAYWRGIVIDWKTKSVDKMRVIREGGAAAVPGEIVQAHLYGYGYAQKGYNVQYVALVFLPRSGRIKDLIVLIEPYDSRIAQYALNRMYEVAGLVSDLDVYQNPDAWADVPATPTDSCGLCPWFDPKRLAAADATGCPG